MKKNFLSALASLDSMKITLLVAGIACVIAGIVGGGIDLPGGYNFPKLASTKIRGALVAFGAILIFFSGAITPKRVDSVHHGPTSWGFFPTYKFNYSIRGLTCEGVLFQTASLVWFQDEFPTASGCPKDHHSLREDTVDGNHVVLCEDDGNCIKFLVSDQADGVDVQVEHATSLPGPWTESHLMHRTSP